MHSPDVLLLLFLGTLLIAGFVTGGSGGHYWEIIRWLAIMAIAKFAIALYSRLHVALAIAAQGPILAGITVTSSVASIGFSWVLDFRLDSEFMHKNDLRAMVGLAIITLLAVTPAWWSAITNRMFGLLAITALGTTLLYLQSLAAVGPRRLALHLWCCGGFYERRLHPCGKLGSV